MGKYFIKKESITPPFSRVYVDSKIPLYDERFKSYSVGKLKSALPLIHKIENLSKFRLLIFSISKALSLHGVAPRWQGLENACVTQDQERALKADAAIIDLFWLAHTFPKHKAINTRWQNLFNSGFNVELAASISERQMHTAKKIKHNLNLTRFEQIGCIHFLTKAQYKVDNEWSVQMLINTSTIKARTAYNREMERCNGMVQMTPEIALQRHLIYLSWLLAESSPTKAAAIYKWMTGTTQDKANIARTVRKMKVQVARPHVM